jgi:16S rRNA (guanine(527)-N(7))-methyltransferase RsmG
MGSMISFPMRDELAEALSASPWANQADEATLERATAYMDLLLGWAEKINLTAITEPEEAVERLFWEAAPALAHLGDGPLLDIGTGAGFPGVPIKILRPRIPVTLLEPRRKRAVFLREVIQALDLEQIEVREERLEDHLGLGKTYQAFCWRALKVNLSDLETITGPDRPVRALHWTTVQGGRDLEVTGWAAWDTMHWVRLHPSDDRVVVILERIR